MQLSHPPKAVHTHSPGISSAKATKHNGHRNSTLRSILKFSPSFGAAPHPVQQQNSGHSAVRKAGFYLKAALLQMVTIKPSQCFPPLLSPNTLWDPGLGAPLKASLNLLYDHKSNTCQCQVLQKEQLFSWSHFLLPEYLRHAKQKPCSKRWVT